MDISGGNMSKLLSINDIAEKLGVSRTRPYAWVKSARLPARQIADVFVVEHEDLIAFTEARMADARKEYERWVAIVENLRNEADD
jgi:hypothetical protein